MAKDTKTVLGLAAAAVGLGLLASQRKRVGAAVTEFVDDLANLAAVPRAVMTYVPLLRDAGQRHGVPSTLLAGILWRESNAGTALKPPGPTGTGDFAPRKAGSLYFKYANPATGLPPDGQGWGRGLMQIDYGVWNSWVLNNDWGNAGTNIDKAASILADFYAYFRAAPSAGVTVTSANVARWAPLLQGLNTGPYRDPRPLSGVALAEAALAAYNAGASNVLQAVAVGLPASTPTTGGEYASWILSHVADWS